MTQNEQILAALKSGPLTPREALERFGCMRLAARVNELRLRGHAISAERAQANGKRFARYRMEQVSR